ncbi:MAG: PEP-CTERM sorting domain-containing protein [Planctomycetota bacterium]|jgi:hypothetical protein
MTKSTRISTLFSAVFFLALLPCAANAYTVDTVDVVSTGLGANELISVWGGGIDGSVEGVYAGSYNLEKTSGTGEGKLWPDGTIGAFCAELSEPAPEITSKYSVTSLDNAFGADKAGYISELWGRYYDSSWTGDGSFTWLQDSKAAAFATALWEIVYEDLPGSSLKWDVTADGTWDASGFRTDFGGAVLANNLLHSLDGTGPMADLRVLSYSGSQDYIANVPEPTTIVLLGIGSLGLLRRKRKSA